MRPHKFKHGLTITDLSHITILVLINKLYPI
jgi:hypothetical protein